MDKENKKVALLIDSDNVSVKYIDTIISELNQYGNIVIRRIYGDWSNPTIKKWLDSTSQYALTPVMQESNTVGKNATDIGLVIDAMKLLYEKKADVFCIVSSDGDFTRLASRLRESGMEVIGMGEEKTPRSFRVACTRFINLENLGNQDENTDSKEKQDNTISRDVIFNAITNIITENENTGKRVELASVGNRLVNMYPDFDVRSYGYSLLSKFVEDAGLFLLEKHQNVITISLKDNEKSQEEIRDYVRTVILASGKKGIGFSELSNLVHGKYAYFNVKDFGYNQFSKFIQSLEGIETFEDKNKRKRAKKAE